MSCLVKPVSQKQTKGAWTWYAVCDTSPRRGNVRIKNFHSGEEVKTPGSWSRNHVILITLITLFYYVRSRQIGVVGEPGGSGRCSHSETDLCVPSFDLLPGLGRGRLCQETAGEGRVGSFIIC